MLIKLTTHRAVLAFSAALLLTTAPVAYAYDTAQPAPSPVTAPTADLDGIAHITGGVGEDEHDAMEAVRADYNVHIINTNKDGAYNDETQLTITDRKGVEVVTADAGPLFFVNLPAGSYTIAAQHREKQQQKKIKVTTSKKTQPDIHFIW